MYVVLAEESRNRKTNSSLNSQLTNYLFVTYGVVPQKLLICADDKELLG
jgi:hypothetical protein